jgi:hypothetical protein
MTHFLDVSVLYFYTSSMISSWAAVVLHTYILCTTSYFYDSRSSTTYSYNDFLYSQPPVPAWRSCQHDTCILLHTRLTIDTRRIAMILLYTNIYSIY